MVDERLLTGQEYYTILIMDLNNDPKMISYINRVILISSLMGLLGAVSIFFLQMKSLGFFMILDFSIFVILITVFILRKKINNSTKTGFLVLICFIYANYALFSKGINRATIPLMASYIVLAYIFLSSLRARVISILAVVTLLTFGILAELEILRPDMEILLSSGSFSYWLLQSLIMVVFIVVSGGAIGLYKRELSRKIEQLENKAFNDHISGLKNYEGMIEHINGRIADSVTEGFFMLLDIKNFRSINSLYGIEYGNRILKLTGDILSSYEDIDIVSGRISSDEFLIWIENVEYSEIISEEENFDKLLKEKMQSLEQNVSILMYKSMAHYPRQGATFDELFAKASLALKQAKNKEQYNISFYTPELEKQTIYENEIAIELEDSRDKDNFTMYYQKKFDLLSGDFTGVEALVRWNTEKLGNISPADFIPIIQKSAMMIPFTIYILKKVLADYNDLIAAMGKEVSVSINIPPCFFLSKQFIGTVKSLVSEAKVCPDRLTFEITENVFIEDPETINRIIKEISDFGIRIALDDFGKGYSSLSYLRTIHINELKIDKSFIDNITEDKKSFELFKSICSIADVYNYTLVAEGVERKEQIDLIKQTNCRIVQGFYFAEPVPLSQLNAEKK